MSAQYASFKTSLAIFSPVIATGGIGTVSTSVLFVLFVLSFVRVVVVVGFGLESFVFDLIL